MLLDIAEQSLRYWLDHGHRLSIQLQDYPPPLQEVRASFVTLRKKSELRGCIGSLEARRPLAEDVLENALAAGFRDPRFPALQARELPDIDIQISVLTRPEPIQFESEANLLDQLRPNCDGLILQEGGRRGTFLPSVWQSLPDGRTFLRQLKVKAGLPENYWSDSLQVFRYSTESFSRSESNKG